MKKERKRRIVLSVSVLVLLWAWVIAAYAVKNEYILPSLTATLQAAGALLCDGGFYLAFGQTMLRTLLAFCVSLVGGAALALVSYFCETVRFFLAPVLSVVRSVPTMAIILILLVWTTPSAAPVIVTATVLLPACYTAALASLDGIDGEYLELARAYRVPFCRTLFRLVLPLSAPSFLSQTGAFLSLGLKVTVSAEVLAKTAQSLGGMMQDAKLWIEMPELFALTLAVIVTGFVLEGGCALIAHFVGRWRK